MAYLFMRREFACVSLTGAFLDDRYMVVVEGEILIHGFVQDEAAVALLAARVSRALILSPGARKVTVFCCIL